MLSVSLAEAPHVADREGRVREEAAMQAPILFSRNRCGTG